MKILSLSFILFIFTPLFTTNLYSTDVGIPLIQNYSSKEYSAHGQNWYAAKGPKGRMYFANSNGLLIYDGIEWELLELPDNPIVRSIYVDSLEFLIGAQEDFGYLKPSNNGSLSFKSLLPLIPDSIKDFSNVWAIHADKKYYYFLTRKYIYIFNQHDKSFNTYLKASTIFHTMFKIDNTILVNQPGYGLSEIKYLNVIKLSNLDLLQENTQNKKL